MPKIQHWFPGLFHVATVCRGYSTILHMNNGTNLVFDELLSSLFSSIGGIVHRGIVSSRLINCGIPGYSRQGRFTDLRRKYSNEEFYIIETPVLVLTLWNCVFH